MGNPDMPTPDHIVEKLIETAREPATHRYSASRGIPGLRRAQAAYYERRFDVTLDPDREVIATLGSKEGFANLAQAITAPGDVVLVPNPSYPIHAFGFIIAGAVDPLCAGRPSPRFPARAGARGRAIRAVAGRAGHQFSLQSDGAGRSLDFYKVVDLRRKSRDLRAVRSRLCRDLFRRRAAAFDPASGGRARYRGRIPLAVQDLFDGRLAHRLRGRQ